MIYFVIRVLVNALAMALTVILAPGFDVAPLLPPVISLSATYIIIGIVFGVINAFVRPTVLLFTASLFIRTMGVAAVVINALLFWLLELLIPTIVIESPQFLWILLASLIMSLVVMVMEALFGLDKPEFANQTENQFYWRWVGLLSSGRRNKIAENIRVAQIFDIIAKYTKDIGVDLTPLARFRIFMQELLYRDTALQTDLTLPEKVRYMLQELGPTFVKFGQIASSRAENIPDDWRAELEKLQSNVPPFPYEDAVEIIRREFGRPPEDLYATFEREPFAAASTAQVHRATLVDGTAVVVKVQRPNIDVTVKADLNVMRDLARQISRRRDWARDADLKGLVNEFADNVLKELDYRNETSNAQLLDFNMAMFEQIVVPDVYPGLCGRRVLTQQFVQGVKITQVGRLDEAGLDRTQIARVFVRAMIKQVLFDGFFHADPHPGNVLVDLETGDVIFLDMGLMGELSRDKRVALADLLWSFQQKDGYSLAKSMMRLSKPFKEFNEAAFVERSERFAMRYLQIGGADLSAATSAFTDLMQSSGLRIDKDMTLALKALVQAEEIVHTLDHSLSMTEVASQDTALLLREHVTTDNLSQIIQKQVTRSAREVAYRLPTLVEATTKWLDQYEKGRVSVHVDTSDLGKQLQVLDKVTRRATSRLILAVVLGGWIIGSAIATSIDSNLLGVRLADVAFYMFVGGALVGLAIVFSSLRAAFMTTDEEED